MTDKEKDQEIERLKEIIHQLAEHIIILEGCDEAEEQTKD